MLLLQLLFEMPIKQYDIKEESVTLKTLLTLLALVVFAFATIAPTQALAKSTLPVELNTSKSEITSPTKRHYVIGISPLNQYPMFQISQNTIDGFGWAVLEAFAHSQNIRFSYKSITLPRLQPALDDGEIDFIFPDSPLWANYRSTKTPNIYSEVIIEAISASFVTRQNAQLRIHDVRKVAIPFGYSAYTWIEPITKYGIKSVPVKDLTMAMFAIHTGKTDVADVEYNNGLYILSNHPEWQNLSVSKHLPHIRVTYHLSSIKHIALLEKISTFVRENEALIQALKKQYGVKYHHEVYTLQP